MRNYVEGTITADDPSFMTHELSCLVCRSCETACPSGVEFGTLMEQTRAVITQKQGSSIKRFGYSKFLRSRPLLNVLQFVTGAAAKLGLLKLGRRLFRPSTKIGTALALVPSTPLVTSRAHLYPSARPNGKRVGLLLGCIGDAFTPQVNDATIKVLNTLGYDVDVLPTLTCCGALAAHGGYLDIAKDLAMQNVAVLADPSLDHVIASIAGCGAMLKEYASLLEGTAAGNTAATVREKTFDINEFLYRFHHDELPSVLAPMFAGKRIAYQAPCHLLHGQCIVTEPLQLLQCLPGVTAFPLEENELCCGSAGSYNIEHPEMGERLRQRKMQIIADARPDIVATANAGCMLQLGKDRTIPVRHVIELIAEALKR
jgi:glycolate oxidase iron-sulfur subunit